MQTTITASDSATAGVTPHLELVLRGVAVDRGLGVGWHERHRVMKILDEEFVGKVLLGEEDIQIGEVPHHPWIPYILLASSSLPPSTTPLRFILIFLPICHQSPYPSSRLDRSKASTLCPVF